jgi:beta-glucosidase-like glycosyl hydrolase
MVPNLNVAVVPQWGRAQETFGESATLTSQLGAAFIRALQFDDACEFGCSTYVKMLAVAKHVFAYHIESYGADGQYRLSHCFNVTPADFTQTYVAPFRAAALVGNVSFYMCEYGGTNGTNPTRGKPSGPEPWGVPSCLHPLMDATLRAPPEAGGFGWSGSVISDEGSITFAGHNSIAATLDFPGAQLELAAAVAAARKPGVPLVVVVLAGSVISSPTVYTAADAVLLAWYPGVKGGAAIADALLGAQSPAGRLPMTVVSDESEVPDVRDF